MLKWVMVVMVLVGGLQGCSKNTRESVKEVGNDMGRDVEDALD